MSFSSIDETMSLVISTRLFFYEKETVNESKGDQTTLIIQYKGDVTEFANSYLKAVKPLLKQRREYRVTLRFTIPVALHYSKYTKDDRCQEEHTVRELFFPNYDRQHEQAITVDYMPTFLRNSGYPLDMEYLLEVDIVDITRSHRKQWGNIAASMRKYRINLDVAADIEAHLRGETPYIQGFGNHWTEYDRPRVMSFADVIKGLSVEQLVEKARKTPPHHVLPLCIYGKERDRSVRFAIQENDEWRFTAASEYAGCGNGDYYYMYSPSVAFFVESD